MARVEGDSLAVLDQLTHTFARGDVADGEAQLLDALERGLDWERVTAAVARGVARRFGEDVDTGRTSGEPPATSSRTRRYAGHAALGVLIFVLLAPVLAVVHQAMVLGVARGVSAFAWWASSAGSVRSLPIDPIYTSAMLLTVGGIETRGLALAGPPGQALHSLWPDLFASPELVAVGAWASAVIEPGATVVSRWLCNLVAGAALLALGIVLVHRGVRGRPWLAALGAVIQAHVVLHHLVESAPELADLEAAGIPFAVAMLLSGDVLAGPRLAERLDALPAPVRDLVIGAFAAGIAYLIAGLSLAVPAGVARVVRLVRSGRLRPRLRLQPTARHRPRGRLVPRVGLACLALGVAVSPIDNFAIAQSHYLPAPDAAFVEPMPEDVAASAPGGPAPGAPASVLPTATASPAPSSPTVVEVTGSDHRYRYAVAGRPTVIRGIGYNVQYAHLDHAERVRRLSRDFAALRRAGVNTVFGWSTPEFDAVLLDVAHAHGLGVAPPFDLDPDEDYADPVVRARLTAAIVAWVERYRGHPAIRMWAIGNEVLHKLVYPSWMPVRSSPEWEARAEAFASFLVQAMDRVREIDPHHPIVHRDAEDAYLTWLRDAMADGKRRPWFVYGINSYTPRLAEILGSWPGQGFDVALLVSEFAPGGMSPADRPQGLRSMWRTIRAAHARVLGGAVYAWTTDGPEEVDRVFGLVDDEGNPVDGSLATVGALFRGVEREEIRGTTGPAAPVDERIWALARDAVVMLQDGRGRELLPPNAVTSVMGNLQNIPREAVRPGDLEIVKVRDPHRLSWQQVAGVRGEWWATWRPLGEPYHKVTFLIQELHGGTLQVGYIYHGPR